MFTEITERNILGQVVSDQRTGGARDEHLPAMSGRADSRRAVHVQTDIVVHRDRGLAGVDSHAHAHLDALGPGLRRKRPLPGDRGSDRIACPRESDEEGVALGVDLATVVRVERRTKQALMLGEHLDIAAAQPRQQQRRALDVGEQKRDGPARKLRHNAQLRPITAACQVPHRARPAHRPSDRYLRRLHGAQARRPSDEGSSLATASLHASLATE
jgi:hypothetical protein